LSWIHLEDAVRVIDFVMAQEAPEAVYNAVAPAPLCHREFARAVGKSSKSLFYLPVPGFVAEALAGEMARELLLSGQRVVPANLERSAFQFNYPTMATALENLLERPAA
jgi:NAD dependent epimerase/dehydratase family enzyme